MDAAGEKSRRNYPMRINTNLTAMNTFTQYTKNNNKIASSVAKLSSGSAINSAADNATGLAISEKMRAQIRGLEKASTNAQDAISLVQSAEGALGSSTEILQRMRELAVQSASDTNENEIDRTALQDEFSQLQKELNDIAKNTTFNKKNLLDGSLAAFGKSVTNATLGNNSLAVTVGNAAAGDYNFNVSVKQETAAVTGAKPTDYSSKLGSTATAYFSAVGGATANLAIGDTSKVILGTSASDSALLNGNYGLAATSNADGSLEVTATGDNGQTFTATLTSSQLDTLETNSALANGAELTLTFNADSKDAFTLAMGVKNFSNTTNGVTSLSSAIQDTTVSVSGGVTAQAATYGAYASMTGGSSVELLTNDTSVTFDNGVTFSFNKLTASDLDTSNKATLDADITATTLVTLGANTASAALTNFKAADSFAGANQLMTFVNTAAGTITATGADGAVYTAEVAAMTGTATGAAQTVNIGTLNFADSAGNTAFTMDVEATSTAAGALAVSSDAVAGTADTANIAASGHNYSKVFGDGTTTTLTNNGASSFTVNETANAGLTFQVGANEGDEMTINIEKVDSQTLGVNSSKVDTQEAAKAAISAVDTAINQVSSQRAYLGAIQNRLDYKISNLNTSTENLTSAESQIRDVDMAKEMTAFTNANILNQASTAMLAQANSLPQAVLSLIGG